MKRDILSQLILLGILVIALLGVGAMLHLPEYLMKLTQVKSLEQTVFRGKAWFKFDDKDALKGWEEKIFKGKVTYSVKTAKKEHYLNAYSSNAASGLLYWVNFNPRQDSMVSWKWKVIKFPDKGSEQKKGGGWLEKDDYAARFYVIFPKFPFFRTQCIEYVWDRDLPKGTALTDPDFKNLKIVVLESGDKNAGNWVTVERNIRDDFKQFFRSQPGNVGAIAVMTDADNSQSTAEAQYDDIKVGYGK